MKKSSESSLTTMAMRALTEAVDKAVEEHRRRGVPLAVWRNGRAVSIPATEARGPDKRAIRNRLKPKAKC
jgi:hypothetical protein